MRLHFALLDYCCLHYLPGAGALPINWCAMENEQVKLVVLPSTSNEYQKVEKAFMRSAGNSAQGVQKVGTFLRQQ